jgi:hypothetical protein
VQAKVSVNFIDFVANAMFQELLIMLPRTPVAFRLRLCLRFARRLTETNSYEL